MVSASCCRTTPWSGRVIPAENMGRIRGVRSPIGTTGVTPGIAAGIAAVKALTRAFSKAWQNTFGAGLGARRAGVRALLIAGSSMAGFRGGVAILKYVTKPVDQSSAAVAGSGAVRVGSKADVSVSTSKGTDLSSFSEPPLRQTFFHFLIPLQEHLCPA